MKSVRILYLVVLALCFSYMVMIADYISFLTLCAALLLPVLLAVQALLLRGKITAVCPEHADFIAEAGQPFQISIRLKNRSFLPLSMGRLSFRCENLLSGQERRLKLRFRLRSFGSTACTLHLQSACCGRLKLTADSFYCYDALGLFRVKGVLLNAPPELTVFPAVLPLSCNLSRQESGDYESDTFSKHRPGDDPSEVFGVREYRPGDPQRSIHWKLSTKRNELIVKEFSLPIQDGTILLAELHQGDPAQLSRELTALFSISSFLAEAERPHRLVWYDSALQDLRELTVTDPDQIPEAMSLLLHAGGTAEDAALLHFVGRQPTRGVDKLYYFTTSFPAQSEEWLRQTLPPTCGRRVFLFGPGDGKQGNVTAFEDRPVDEVLQGMAL